jgi:cell division initiation protein
VIDESFHLTPLDVRRTEFPAALRGYDRARVDEFRDRVANELERLTRLNHELENKAKGFHEQLRAFRERDKALNEALVSAQQLRAETRDQAEREAQLSLREAKAEGDRLIDAAKAEVRRLAGEIEALERSRRAYLAQLRSMVARQLAELEAIPETNANYTAPSATATAPAPATPAPATESSATSRGEPATGGKGRKEPTTAGGKPPVPATAGAAQAAPPPPPPGAAPVAPRTTTVPLAAVPPNGAAPETDEKKPDEKKDSDEGARQHVQTPGWLKAVPSDK